MEAVMQNFLEVVLGGHENVSVHAVVAYHYVISSAFLYSGFKYGKVAVSTSRVPALAGEQFVPPSGMPCTQ